MLTSMPVELLPRAHRAAVRSLQRDYPEVYGSLDESTIRRWFVPGSYAELRRTPTMPLLMSRPTWLRPLACPSAAAPLPRRTQSPMLRASPASSPA